MWAGDVRSSETRAATDGCEPPYECWKLSHGPMLDQQVHLIVESSLQPNFFFILFFFLFLSFFWGMVSLYSFSLSGASYVDQIDL